MYSDVMNRTQIYLTDDEVALLDAEATRSGATRSELIRRAIRAQYGSMDADARRRALLASAGSWKDRTFTGEEYVEAIRGDLNKRLKRLGLE
jgi:hypothetical protein